MRKVLIENIIFLYLLQGANYILPLLTFPYLVRILGISQFGLLAFAISFISYFVLITDYGYNLSATRQISIVRDDHHLLSKTFWVVMCAKTLLFIASMLVISILLLIVPKLHSDAKLYWACSIAVAGNLLFPLWYFQGLEKMKYIALVNITAKVITTIAIFTFVRTSSDLLITAFIQSSGVVISGILGLALIWFVKPISLIMPSVKEIYSSFRDGWNVFITLIAATLVNNSNTFLLGLLTNNQMVGYFSIAEKITKVFINLCTPISGAIFPRVSLLLNESRERGVLFLKRLLKIGVAVFAFMSIILFLCADIFVKLISGSYIPIISTMIRIMAILPVSIFIDNLYGTQLLVNIGKANLFMRAVLFPGIGSIILSLIFVHRWGGIATATIFTVVELFILGFMVFYVRRENIFLIHDRFV